MRNFFGQLFGGGKKSNTAPPPSAETKPTAVAPHSASADQKPQAHLVSKPTTPYGAVIPSASYTAKPTEPDLSHQREVKLRQSPRNSSPAPFSLDTSEHGEKGAKEKDHAEQGEKYERLMGNHDMNDLAEFLEDGDVEEAHQSHAEFTASVVVHGELLEKAEQEIDNKLQDILATLPAAVEALVPADLRCSFLMGRTSSNASLQQSINGIIEKDEEDTAVKIDVNADHPLAIDRDILSPYEDHHFFEEQEAKLMSADTDFSQASTVAFLHTGKQKPTHSPIEVHDSMCGTGVEITNETAALSEDELMDMLEEDAATRESADQAAKADVNREFMSFAEAASPSDDTPTLIRYLCPTPATPTKSEAEENYLSEFENEEERSYRAADHEQKAGAQEMTVGETLLAMLDNQGQHERAEDQSCLDEYLFEDSSSLYSMQEFGDGQVQIQNPNAVVPDTMTTADDQEKSVIHSLVDASSPPRIDPSAAADGNHYDDDFIHADPEESPLESSLSSRTLAACTAPIGVVDQQLAVPVRAPAAASEDRDNDSQAVCENIAPIVAVDQQLAVPACSTEAASEARDDDLQEAVKPSSISNVPNNLRGNESSIKEDSDSEELSKGSSQRESRFSDERSIPVLRRQTSTFRPFNVRKNNDAYDLDTNQAATNSPAATGRSLTQYSTATSIASAAYVPAIEEADAFPATPSASFKSNARSNVTRLRSFVFGARALDGKGDGIDYEAARREALEVAERLSRLKEEQMQQQRLANEARRKRQEEELAREMEYQARYGKARSLGFHSIKVGLTRKEYSDFLARTPVQPLAVIENQPFRPLGMFNSSSNTHPFEERSTVSNAKSASPVGDATVDQSTENSHRPFVIGGDLPSISTTPPVLPPQLPLQQTQKSPVRRMTIVRSERNSLSMRSSAGENDRNVVSAAQLIQQHLRNALKSQLNVENQEMMKVVAELQSDDLIEKRFGWDRDYDDAGVIQGGLASAGSSSVASSAAPTFRDNHSEPDFTRRMLNHRKKQFRSRSRSRSPMKQLSFRSQLLLSTQSSKRQSESVSASLSSLDSASLHGDRNGAVYIDPAKTSALHSQRPMEHAAAGKILNAYRPWSRSRAKDALESLLEKVSSRIQEEEEESRPQSAEPSASPTKTMSRPHTGKVHKRQSQVLSTRPRSTPSASIADQTKSVSVVFLDREHSNSGSPGLSRAGSALRRQSSSRSMVNSTPASRGSTPRSRSQKKLKVRISSKSPTNKTSSDNSLPSLRSGKSPLASPSSGKRSRRASEEISFPLISPEKAKDETASVVKEVKRTRSPLVINVMTLSQMLSMATGSDRRSLR